jgi:hypothetical protein
MTNLFNQPPLRSYHNTNGETPEQHAKSNSVAKSQENTIYGIFKRNKDLEYSREDIYKIYIDQGNTIVPMSSISRAITNLKTEGLIYKTKNQKVGEWGKKIYTWKLL